MNKERAIEILKNIIKSNEYEIKKIEERNKKMKWATVIDKHPQERIQALDIAIDSLDNEWVDVRDRLPSEDYQDVLVTLQSGNIDIGHMFTAVDTQEDKSERLFFHESQTNEDIIAWKPLPQPYERKEQVC